jgi:hypothetical protein
VSDRCSLNDAIHLYPLHFVQQKKSQLKQHINEIANKNGLHKMKKKHTKYLLLQKIIYVLQYNTPIQRK